MIQIGTATSAGSWIKLTAIGAATASKPSAAATVSDGDQRATTNARSELEHQRLEQSRRCARTTGTTTATDTALSGTPGTWAHTLKATTGTATRARSAADDGSARAATTATRGRRPGSGGGAHRPRTTADETLQPRCRLYFAVPGADIVLRVES